MPVFDWDSAGNRWVTDTLIDCNPAPVNNDDLCNKLYVDTVVGGAAIFMSMYATPQLAVAAAIASGVNAIFVDDVFTITVPVNLNSDGLAFIGLGPDTGFIVNDAAATGALTIPNANVVVQNLSIVVTACAAAAEIITVAGARVRLEGIRITFGAAVVAARGIYLSAGTDHILHQVTLDCSGGATVTTGIEVISDRTGIIACWISSANQDNIYINTAYDCEIRGGYNLSAGRYGVQWHTPITDPIVRSLIIADCTILDAGVHGLYGSSYGYAFYMVAVDGCTIVRPVQACICRARGEVTGCDLRDFGTNAIFTNAGLRINGNTISSETNTDYAIEADASLQTIVGNEIYSNNGGIKMSSLFGSAIVTNNQIYHGALEGIFIGVDVPGAMLVNNSIAPIAGGGVDGIKLLGAGSDHCVIKGNYITTHTGDGIYLADHDYCVIEGNVIDTVGSNGIELAGNSTRNNINNNVTSTCTTDGIFLADTCDFNLIGLNQVPDGLTMGAGVNNEHYHNMV